MSKQEDDAKHWSDARDSVPRLANMPENWDGEGADRFREELISPVFLFLRKTETFCDVPPSSVYLLCDGTAMVEWHFPTGEVVVANIRKLDKCKLE